MFQCRAVSGALAGSKPRMSRAARMSSREKATVKSRDARPLYEWAARRRHRAGSRRRLNEICCAPVTRAGASS